MCEPQGPWAPGLLLPMAVFAYGHATSYGLSCFCDITLLGVKSMQKQAYQTDGSWADRWIMDRQTDVRSDG